ncbi:MAG: sensor histidine kinase [Betaproteobacteria bacterium]
MPDRSPPTRQSVLVASLFAVIVALSGMLAPSARCAPVVYDSAESLHDSSDIPPPDAAAWSPQKFPDNWNITRRGIGGTVWYRFDFRMHAPTAAYAVYLPRVSMNAAVYVNGLLVGSGGSFDEPVARNWNRPLYYLIPPGVLKDGKNRVHIRVRGYPDLDGGLSAPIIDLDSALADDYERALFWRIILAQTTSLLIVAVGIFMLMLWVRRRQDAAFGYFGFASLLWAFYTADLYVRDIPVPTFYWELAIRSSFHGFALLLALFAIDYATTDPPQVRRLRATLWVMMALVPVTFFIGEASSLFVLSSVWHFTTFIAATGASMLALGVAWRRRSWQAVSLSAIGFLTIAFALHDVLVKGGWLADDNVNLLMYAAPPLFLGIGWMLTDQFIRTLSEMETLNRELEARVAEKSAALAANYSRLAQAEKLHALAEERQRLMRDMHDGVGGQLITALAALEGGKTAPADVAQIVRECIDDLRLVIDSMEPIDDDLLAVLGSLRYRLEPRLNAAGIQLVWQVHELPALPNLTPRNVLHILRVLQEALTNVLKHAGAMRITVTTGVDAAAGGAWIQVRDDGHGFPEERAAPSGRGLANMRKRAEALGGRLDVDSDTRGSRITLLLPLARIAPAHVPRSRDGSANGGRLPS